MKSKIPLILCLMLFIVVITGNQARTDGDAPSRPATVPEKNFYGNVLKTIDSALPPAPANWKAVTKPLIEPPKEVFENGSYRAKYTGSWLNQAQKPDPAAGMMIPGQNSAALEEAMQQMMKASQSGDTKAFEAAQAKMMGAMGSSKQTLAARKQPTDESSAGDSCLQVEVVINDTAIGLRKSTPLNISGIGKAFLLDDGNKSMKDCPYGQGVVLLGRWGKADPAGEYTYFRTSLRKEIPFPKVENIAVKVRASKERINEYLNSVKWDKLNSLLAK
jgi:hypothetical protein